MFANTSPKTCATIAVAMTAHAVPAGFRPVSIGGEFLNTIGPLHGRWDGERVRLGFRVEERHANIARACHGGMLTSFADMQMVVVTHYQWPEIAGHSFPTISLTTDFVASVPLGAWLEGTADVIRATSEPRLHPGHRHRRRRDGASLQRRLQDRAEA